MTEQALTPWAQAAKMSEPPTLLQGDCFEVLRTLEAESVDACVTDPPYGFGDGKSAGFMGKATAQLRLDL